ncbi:MAG: PepSY domain-containing protein [Sideroxyarcus sp.]|nr:PepSY domain-containing protein [Sideroxyarcus sp.]
MKLLKIFPTAAGVIALSATVSFARDLRDMDEEDFSRVLIVSVNSNVDAGQAANNDGRSQHAYHVEINRGEKKWLVSIDAFTGKILEKRDASVPTV